MAKVIVGTLVSIGTRLQRPHQEKILGLLSSLPFKQCNAISYLNHCQCFSSHKITRNLELITHDVGNIQFDPKSLVVKSSCDRPLVVILEWISAKKKHVQKYTDLYFDNGYDVLVVPTKPMHLLRPVKGSQLVAEDLLQFLAANPMYKQVMVHGFSVGGYLWGEVCLQIHKYPSVSQQLIGQVWDSLVDVIGAGHGLATAIFPSNNFLKTMVQSLIQLHLWIFQNIATKYYQASSACFYNPPVVVPSLMFLSRADRICSFRESLDVAESWRKRGVKVTVKVWDSSRHVNHYREHTEEYVSVLNTYLQSINLPLIRNVDGKTFPMAVKGH